MREGIKDWVRKTYGLDLLDDVLLDEKQVSLLIDLQTRPVSIRALCGDMGDLGLPLGDDFSFSELIPYIESDNTLSEVQGRKTFIKDFVKRIQKIEYQRTLHIPIRTGEDVYWLRVVFKALESKQGRPTLLFAQVVEVFTHVPDLITYYQKTHQDALTRLFTRETLKKHIETQKHSEGVYGMYVDLDNFKKINDQWGHLEGDRFLTRLARAFIDRWEPNVIYYRLGGDEFFIYIYHHTEDAALRKARKVIDLVEAVGRDGGMPAISASLGLVPIRPGMGYHTVLDASDRAMYASKDRGRGNITLVTRDRVVAYDKKSGKRVIHASKDTDELVD